MRIKSITIEGLFDMFTHVIPLNMKEHITIIYGANGMGKTMVFRIIHAFFERNFGELAKLPFRGCRIEFEENVIYIKKEDSIFNVFLNETKAFEFNSDSYGDNISNGDIGLDNTFKLLDLQTYLIETQRLISIKKEAKYSLNAKYEPIEQTEIVGLQTILKYGKHLAKKIQALKHESDKLSNTLRSSLGDRISKGEVNITYSSEKLAEEIEKINRKVEELKAVGLVEKDFKGYSWRTDNVNEIQRAIFSVNIQDTQQILAAFDEIYPKLALFVEILNEKRLTFKHISIDEKEGFIIVNDNGKKLALTELSSGEQHEIILLYLMLFEIPENALIMIDEPEISLHIDWQSDFVNDLTEIIKLRGFDVMLATHSPDIVTGRIELTVSLNKQEKQVYAN